MWWATVALASLGTSVVDLSAEMIEAAGPRATGSEGAVEAQRWVARELDARGWSPSVLAGGSAYPTVYACRRGERRAVVLFLAHTDAVHPEVPGANDNAAAVAVLLKAIEKLPRRPTRTVCVAFPDAEEVGLLGSEVFARFTEKLGLGGRIDQVMALDLVGQGRLTHNGLGPAWGTAQLRWMMRHAPAEVPWVYRGVSWAWPHMERSDHRPFTERGVASSHLMARGPSGVYWAYHSREDTLDQLEPATLAQAVRLVRKVAKAPPLPKRGPDPAVVLPSGTVMPGRVVEGVTAVGLLALLAPLGADRSISWPLLHVVVGALAFGTALGLALAGRGLDQALAEPALLAAWCAWAAVWVGWPWPGSARSGRVLCGATALVAAGVWWWMGPILALPLAISALAGVLVGRVPSGLLALPALWPAGYFVRPDAVRELAFHGLLPASPWVWTLVHLFLTLPLVALVQGRALGRGRRRQGLAAALAAASVAAILWAWMSPEAAAPYLRPEVLWPQP